MTFFVTIVAAATLLLSANAAAFPISIDPGAYTGRYSIQGGGVATGFVSGNQTFVLPSGEYTVETGASAVAGGAASYFRFTVDSGGQVTAVTNPVTLGVSGAADGSGSTLHFRNVAVTVNPSLYAGRYFLTSHVPASFTGLETVILVPDLLYTFDVGSFVFIGTATSYFLFTLDGAGQVTSVIDPVTQTASGAATGSGSTLTLNNVLVHIDPTPYTGAYNVAGYLFLVGPVTIALVPTLATGVIVGNEVFYIVPDVSGVAPSSLTFVIGGQTYVFLVSGQPAVTIAGVSPEILVQGATNQILTVTGTNFAAGASVSFSGTGILVLGSTVVSGTEITATVEVAANAPTGARDVTVTDPGGASGTGAGLLTIVTQHDFLATLCGLISSFTSSGQIAPPGISKSLLTSCDNVGRLIGVHNRAVREMLGAMRKRLDAFVKAGKVTPVAYKALVTEINALISSLPRRAPEPEDDLSPRAHDRPERRR